uniref:Cytoplasmic dynein 2 heavy chain 1 (inferred by orthology to a C. elegans protein) n=1 Tax=Anisakis simplex TaxID=6269 RepID=A0A158PNV8_ANISI
LRKAHDEICTKVIDLMNLDLLKEVNKWKDLMLTIRSKFTEQERYAGSKGNMRPWLVHWDRQLYKALNLQYRWGIESLHVQIPQIQAQLVFKEQRLQLRPPVEEIRAKYYREMKKFLSIPHKFRGIEDTEHSNKVFAIMIERNATRFRSVYEKAEQLFDKLSSVDSYFEDWIVLGQVDLEQLIDEKFVHAADWEAQIKMLKGKGREADKLPRLFNILRFVHFCWVIAQFLSQAISVLSSRPESVDAIAEANHKHTEFARENKAIGYTAEYKMKETLSVIEEKNTLLRAVGGSGADQLVSVMQQWEKFELMLDSHQVMIKEQVNVLKLNVTKNIQVLNEEAEKLLARWNQFKPSNETLAADRSALLNAIEFIKEKRVQFDEIDASRRKILLECDQFDVEKPGFEMIEEMRIDLEEFESNWILYEQFNGELEKLADEEWIIFRSKTYLFDEFLNEWTEKVRSLPVTHMTVRIGKDLDNFKEMSAGLKYCRGEVLSSDHWLELFRLLGMPKGSTPERLRFRDLLNVHDQIVTNIEALKSLNARAQGEVTIREAIQELELWAAQTEFSLSEYKHSNGSTIKVVKDWKESINAVKDSEALLQSLKNSPFYAQFTDKTSVWETKLTELSQYLQWMNEIQRKWIYLEPIFGRGSLPSEASRFNRVDVEFRAILNVTTDVARDSRLASLCSRQSLRRTLEQILDQLNRCQRALNQFLEEKRNAFPRFYFLGDDDLLEILGQSMNPVIIQTHLKKLFQGINRVVFGEANSTLIAIVSAEGERVQLSKHVRIVAQVEFPITLNAFQQESLQVWLQDLSDEMRRTIRLLTMNCLREANLDAGKYPSQVLCLAEQIRFCTDCEKTLDKTQDLHAFRQQLSDQLVNYTNSRVDDVVLELKLKSLILDLIHHIQIVDELIQQKASSSSCWCWQKQLRFYVDSSAQHVFIRQVNTQFDYTYEYQGNAAKLVHTPLTDKCYLTLTQAMSMGLGGNPYGPAGTGKTESVKALANLFGRQVLVFNCDEGIDVHSMSRIFIGLIQCGAWGCFDEFNRLDQQRKLILYNMRKNSDSSLGSFDASTDDTECDQAALRHVHTWQQQAIVHLYIRNNANFSYLQVSVDPNSAIFITLNPAGKGYGGRQKLPDNLKQLFRPVAMSIPDNELIAETILYSDGFKDAKLLARKLVTMFTLSREMLSQQQHYDWGLRALKSVLRGCGDMLRVNSNKDERQVVVEALLLNTLSKLTFADSRRFRILIDDVFSDVNQTSTQFDDLIGPLKKASDEMKMTITAVQVRKLFELYEQLRQRMGVVLVGPSGCGKSTLWKLLRRTLIIAGKSLKTYMVNPKSMSKTKLLGYMDLDTREWFDGVLTSAAREVVKDSNVYSWIICDGDIDPEWIEALNSVLDDNRLLTMPSGERIQFAANVNFIFETDDLSSASPATISRMGMIFISDEDMDEKEIVRKWLKDDDDLHPDMQQWLDDHLYRCVKWIRDKSEYEIDVSRTAILHNALSQLRYCKCVEEFLVGLYRGLASNLSEETRNIFARDVRRKYFTYMCIKLNNRFEVTCICWHNVERFRVQVLFNGIALPDPHSPSNVYYDSRLHSFASYTDDTVANITKEQLLHKRQRPLILTAAAQANCDTINCWLQEGNRHPFIVFGPDGCGKETLLRHCFETDTNSQLAVLHCNAQTSAEQLIQVLTQHCVHASSTSGRVLKPKDKPNLIVYLKSINLVKPDKWGCCELIAFVQQLLTYQGFYDEKLEWIGLQNVQLVASIIVDDVVARQPLASRFTSLMRICSVRYPCKTSLISIYSAYLTPILQESSQSMAHVEHIASMIVQIFEQIRSAFKRTDTAHYIFTPRDVTDWCLALMRYDIKGSFLKLLSVEISGENILKCLLYEGERIFRDRLVNSNHTQRFDEIVIDVTSTSISCNDGSVYITSSGAFNPHTSMTGKRLSMVPRKEYTKQLQTAINRYQSEVSIFNLPLFDELVTLCAQVDRVITCAGGCALLAGRAGMGRRAVTSLCAYIHDMKIFSPNMRPSYSLNHFKDELKTAMQSAAVDDEQVVFILEDYQMLEATFLQYTDSILASGDLPGLFTAQEFDAFSASLRDQASQDAYQGDLHTYFAFKVRMNMHIVLIMDIDGSEFSSMCSANRSVYKECTVIWKERWSKDTFLQIPRLILGSHNLKPSDDLVACFAQMFDACPTCVSSPAKFCAFINNYINIFNKKQHAIEGRLNRLNAGVGKLTEARAAVEVMQKEAAKKTKLLAAKQNEADMALKTISQSMTGANEQKADMEQLKTATEKENKRIEGQKKVIEEQLREKYLLEQVEPILSEAREAVGSIKSESLSEIRSLRAPPEAIRDILQAVLLFMGILDTSWEAMRKFLAKSGVKEEIINFDARRITPEVSRKVTTLMTTKQSSFDPKNAKRASAAAAPLAAWVRANVQYSSILEKIAPLEQEKDELVRNLGKAEKQMAKLSKGLRTVEERVADLKSNFEVLMKEATQIKIELDKEKATIEVAATLIERLGGEFERWQEQRNTLQAELDQLERRSVLSAAFITFLGCASDQQRKSVMNEWIKLTNIKDFDPLRFASMETEQVEFTGIYKLIEVELGVRFGKCLVVKDVVEIDPALMRLLRMELSNQGPRQVAQIGDKTIDYNAEFRIYFCTKNTQMALSRSMKAAFAEINFSITRSGLSSQMLGIAIEIEKPELESRSSELTRNAEKLKLELDQLEQVLLQALASSEGSLLQNNQLLDSLNKSKENADNVFASLQEADKLRNELNQQRDAYLPIAEFASALYFAICDLHAHNHMYDFSVNAIINLFTKTIVKHGQVKTNTNWFGLLQNSSNSSSRFEKLKRALQNTVFEYISRSLFKKDRLMFSLNFIHSTQPNLFQKNEWEIFTGSIVSESRDEPSLKQITWIENDRKGAVAKIQSHLPTLYNNLRLSDQGTWSEFARSPNCETVFPSTIDSLITPFQKVILIQAIRPDRLYTAMTLFATKALGINSISASLLNLKALVQNESNEREPILIMTTAGADPSQRLLITVEDLEDLAKNEVGLSRFHQVPMGQGQLQNAIEALRSAAENGDWVCLKNVHLVIASLPAIQKELSMLQRHPSFRIWLTSEPDDKFPSMLLQESLKLSFEAPPGVRNNMNRTYAQWRDSGMNGGAVRLQCLFVLAWMHALIQERRTFVPQAWSKFYEFSNADLRAAKVLIEQMTKSDLKVPDWQFVHGLMQNVIYGGRIDNPFDENVLNGYLLSYFNSSMISTTSHEIAKNIKIPASNRLDDYIATIEKSIPTEDTPALFGLPDNIRTSWEVIESEATIRQIRNLQIGGGIDSLLDRATLQNLLNPILNIWKRLNAHSSLHSMQLPQAISSDDPFVESLSLEFVFAVILVQDVHRSLTVLNKCLRGILQPSSATIKLQHSLMLHQTPDSWQSIWAGPTEPVQYLASLMYRANSTQELLSAAESGQLRSNSVKLSKLFRPGTLLNALKQLTARKTKKSMDELKLATAWDRALLSDQLTMDLSGLYIQGALFESSLSDTNSSSPSLSPTPKLSVAWIATDQPDVYDGSKSVFVPLYTSPDRQQLVTQVQIPTNQHPQKWQIASVALFLSTH